MRSELLKPYDVATNTLKELSGAENLSDTSLNFRSVLTQNPEAVKGREKEFANTARNTLNWLYMHISGDNPKKAWNAYLSTYNILNGLTEIDDPSTQLVIAERVVLNVKDDVSSNEGDKLKMAASGEAIRLLGNPARVKNLYSETIFYLARQGDSSRTALASITERRNSPQRMPTSIKG
jgi:hypothetical protein